MRTSFFLNPRYLCNLLIALSWLLAFSHSEERCSSKDNLLSILAPSSFYGFFWSDLISNNVETVLVSHIWISFHYNFVKFVCIYNHIIFFKPISSNWLSLSKVFTSFSIENSADEIVLSSARLCSSDSLTCKIKSFLN